GFEHGRVLFRKGQAHAAVVRFDVEPRAVPAIALEIDGDAAVGRLAADVAADVGERDAAVGGAELRGAAEVGDRDSAVARMQRQHGRGRHLDVEAHRPILVAIVIGAVGLDAAAGGLDPHPGYHRFGVGVGTAVAHDAGADERVAAVPAANANAAVV